MPRFFQHIEKGQDNLGKITRLKYIDDITDPEMVLYYFEDGTYCNEDFIAPYDTQEPLQSKKAMIEIASPNSVWKFKKRVVEFDTEQKFATGPDGQVYSAPMPENITTDENGMPISADHGRPGQTFWDVERAPRVPANFQPEPNEDFMLSEHPELEMGISSAADMTPAQPTVKKPVVRKVQPAPQKRTVNVTPGRNDFDFDATDEIPAYHAPQKRTVAPASPAVTFTGGEVDLSNISGKIRFMTQRGDINATTDEIIEGLAAKAELDIVRKRLAEMEEKQRYSMACVENEDVLIKNMIDKSRKKQCKITMSITLELPPKEVYDTIRNVYEEGMAEQFVSSMTARIPQESLLKSLNAGLQKYYESDAAPKAGSKKSSQTDHSDQK